MCTMFSEMYLVMSFLTFITCSCNVNAASARNDGKFYYYGYGSNLLAKRLHIMNPSAVFYSTAKLENYRLDFNMYADTWNGAVATIVEDQGETVWGSLWTLDKDQINYLDEQEGVSLGWYYPKSVNVTTPNGKTVLARTYLETEIPSKLAKGEDLPIERRPSNTYLEVIALGAIESKLPAEYIGFIFSFPTNGQMAPAKIRKELGYPF
ncbi:gamma-glutamylcyclotransferase-like [Anticarsia gemmatalis]|uniref:gamma-glutamylcyclotransferase-like n=1 Tax=Anticarsia gemmatalis TaxID=129554 RepID=UPI003F764920